MIDNYIRSVDNEHHLTEYTLSAGKVVTLAKEEPEELSLSKFIVKVWETEYDRDKGECDNSYFDTLDEALAEAKCYGTRPACVEVVDDEYSTFYHMSEDGILEDVDGNIEF